jgi:hypothetical protein
MKNWEVNRIFTFTFNFLVKAYNLGILQNT